MVVLPAPFRPTKPNSVPGATENVSPIVGSLTIAGPVVYNLLGGASAKARLDNMKNRLALHNDAVVAVLFLVFGVDLIAKLLPPLT